MPSHWKRLGMLVPIEKGMFDAISPAVETIGRAAPPSLFEMKE